MQLKNIAPAVLALVAAACNPAGDKKIETTGSGGDPIVTHAKRFTIKKEGNSYVLDIYGDRHNRSVTAEFVLSPDTSGLSRIYRYREAKIIKTPCKKIAALSSIYANMFYELGVPDYLAAVDNMDYIINPKIIRRHKQNPFPELAKAPHIDIEQTVALDPDILFTFGMGDGTRDVDKKLAQTRIPVAISVDHLEESPLARAEWIKFFAVFAGRLDAADSIFKSVESDYTKLKELASKVEKKPTVFSEIKYSEFWYMPGGRSYMACLMKDAGANYLWSDNLDFGSLPLSFEQVYARARNADYWLNLSLLRSKKELLAGESRYADFKAYKSGNLYNNNKRTNQLGYSDYWETGMIYPGRILSDLIHIFHPQLKAQLTDGLFYYQQLK